MTTEPKTVEELTDQLVRAFNRCRDPRVSELESKCEELNHRVAEIEETVRNLTGDGR